MFKCNHCDKLYSTKRSRGGHQRVHSNKIRSGKEIEILLLESSKQREICKEKYFKNPIYCSNCCKIIPYEKGINRKSQKKYRKYINCFCNSSCAAIYNNKNKTHGTRRSKLEIWLEEQLTSIYPNIKIDYNKKDAINSELDIYIPSLKLAFELNGIFHYEPIYGESKLDQIQNNDRRKFQACLERGIELCIIDVSSLKYFKEKNTLPFLKIIVDIINKLCGYDLNVQCLSAEVPKTSESTIPPPHNII